MAKTKLAGIEMEGLPTVGENFKKMGEVKVKYKMEIRKNKLNMLEGAKRLKLGMGNGIKLLGKKAGEKKDDIDMHPDAVDATFTRVEEKPKKIEDKKE